MRFREAGPTLGSDGSLSAVRPLPSLQPARRMSTVEWRWWPLTDLPVLVGAVVAAVVLPAERAFDVTAAIALIALFIVAEQIRVQIGTCWASGVQPVFVAMLVLEPAHVAPLLVVTAALLGGLLDLAARRPLRARLPRVVGNQWFALPPAVILASVPQPVAWHWWAVALVAGFAADVVMGRVRIRGGREAPAPWSVHLTPAVFDGIVTLPVLVTCLQAPDTAAAWVVPVSLVAMSALVARERGGRIYNEELAGHDPLTGLANRRLFEQLLQSAGARAVRSGHPGAVIVIDVDGFKEVNDLHGHGRGDDVLREVADHLRSIVRAGDEIARLGGDEFAVLLADADGAERVSAALHACLVETTTAGSSPCVIGVSAGWATFGAHRPPAEAVDEADRCMYESKRRRVGR